MGGAALPWDQLGIISALAISADGGNPMVRLILAPALVFGLLAIPAPTQAKPGGCLKYGAAGAVAGHYAGHHGVMGAVAGCALGMHKRREYKRELRMQHQTSAPTTTRPGTGTYTGSY
jgi:hypothetical protein